jgi:hypothetical protein
MDPQAASNMASLLPMKFSSVVDVDTFLGMEAFAAPEALEKPTRKARINVTRMGKEEKNFMTGSRTVVVYGCWVGRWLDALFEGRSEDYDRL